MFRRECTRAVWWLATEFTGKKALRFALSDITRALVLQPPRATRYAGAVAACQPKSVRSIPAQACGSVSITKTTPKSAPTR